MASVLILGGTAFVGEAVAQYLIEQGYEVDIFTRGIRPVKYKGVREHLKGDRKSQEDVMRLLKHRAYDYVIDVSGYEPADFDNVFKYLDISQLIRYVFISTGGVYEDSDALMDEDSPKVVDMSAGAYCFNKKMCEDAIREFSDTSGLLYTILRPSYIYGKGNSQYREAYYFDSVLHGAKVKIPYGKFCKVNFIYIDDLVKLIQSAMESSKAIRKAYNATMGESVTWAQYTMAVNLAMRQSMEIERVGYDRIESGEKFYFPFYDKNYALSLERGKQDGLYQPQITLIKGMQFSFDWYTENNNRMEL